MVADRSLMADNEDVAERLLPVRLRSWSRNVSMAIYWFIVVVLVAGVILLAVLSSVASASVVAGLSGSAGVVAAVLTLRARVVVRSDGGIDVQNPLRGRSVRPSDVVAVHLGTVAGRQTAPRLALRNGDEITLAALDASATERLRQVAAWPKGLSWPEWPGKQSLRGLVRVLLGKQG